MQWLVSLILQIVGLFINRKPSATVEAEKAGAAQAQVSALQQDATDVQKAVQAANASRAATANPDSLRAPDDPDCRDCKA